MALRTPLPVQPNLYMTDTEGRPLDNGKVYFGQAGKDPQMSPIGVFYDAALTLFAAQPIRTKSGFLNNAGNTVGIYAAATTYSVKILDANDRQVLYLANMTQGEDFNAAISAEITRSRAAEAENKALIVAEVARSNLKYSEIDAKTNALDVKDAALQTQINSVGGGKKSYTTKALMESDKANITANSSVDVTNDTTIDNNGTYSYNGTVFTKSAYDPQAIILSKVASVFGSFSIMSASSLPNDSYAVVTNDSDLLKNGYYQKLLGAWVYLKYNPILTAAINLNKNDTKTPQSGKSIDDYISDVGVVPSTNPADAVVIPLSLYSGASDAGLNIGYLNANGVLVADSGSRTAQFNLPVGKTILSKFHFNTDSYFVLLNSANEIVYIGTTLTVKNLLLPPTATKLFATVSFGDASLNQNFNTNSIYFTTHTIGDRGNGALRERDTVADKNKPTVKSSDFLLSTLPNYSTAKPISTTLNANISEIFNGRVDATGSVVNDGVGSYTAKIPIPVGAVSFTTNISSQHYYSLPDIKLRVITGKGVTSEKNVKIPSGAAFLIVTVKIGAFEADLTKDKITFYYDDTGYVLNDTLGRKFIDEEAVEGVGKIMIGRNLYTVDGVDFRIYPSALFSGFCPTINYAIETYGALLNKGHYSRVVSAGVITTYVYDLKRRLIDAKTSVVHKKPMPTALAIPVSPSNKAQALFIGDSLIHNDANLIGAEWLSMINTDRPSEILAGDLVYLPSYNISKGNLELVGQLGRAENKYEIGNKLSTLMEGDFGNGVGYNDHNPFYDVTSAKPNTIGADGWNQRVDIAKYLQSVCGAGKYPDYIYIACGVNDIAELGWDIKQLPLVRNRMKAVLSKIKAACDFIAGGSSNVQIMVMNHQFYPINEGTYQLFSTQAQRLLWAEHYTAYEDMIDNDTVNGVRLNTFARFVDCASSFDESYAYNYTVERANPRTTNEQKFIVDTVHIGTNGSMLYADALLRDFLYHECV